MAALTEHYLGLPEKQRAAILKQIEVDVQRSLQDFQRHTNQVFYLARDKVSTIFDQHVLSLQQRQLLPESYAQLYHLVSDILLTLQNFGGFADEALVAKAIDGGQKTKMLLPILTAIKDYQNEDD